MSPANKFWLGVLLLIMILIGCISIWIPIVLYIMYSIPIGIIYMVEKDYQSKEKNKEFRDKPWVRFSLLFLISYLIGKFNTYLNNKFSKDG